MTLPDALKPHLKRKVRLIASECGPHVQAFFKLAYAKQTAWSHSESLAMLAELDACELALQDWLLLK